MKERKIICLFLCTALFVALAGCTGDPATTTVTTEQTQPTTQETATETTVETTVGYIDPSVTYHAPMATVSLPTTVESSKASDGTTLFTYTYQAMNLSLQDAMVADEILVDHLNRLDDANASAKDLQAAAEAAYAGQENWEPYSFHMLYQPMRFDEMVLSLFATESIFDGNNRGNYANLSVTYDLLTGKPLGIRDVLVADYSAEDLVELIVQGLSEYEKQELLFPDYRELISDMFFTNRPVENWYFTQEGLCFYFSPYEIAPYSSGTLVSKVPYDQLGNLLKDSYFPAETVRFSGTPIVKDFTTADMGNISRFAELILEKDAPQKLLYAEGTLLNVRIETGTWSKYTGISFYPEATVFAATAISKGDAVMIQCADLSDLRLTYEANGQVVSVPLK